MEIRLTTHNDWQRLKQVRLAALLDSPTAFGVSYQTAAGYTDEQWQQRASSMGTAFWLAMLEDDPLGMVGAAVSDTGRFNLIGMWLAPDARGNGGAEQLVEAVKARALERGHGQVYLDVSPENARAVSFYLKQGFVFVDEWEALESHPHVTLQGMVWDAGRMRIILNRDSVCAGDDMESHKTSIDLEPSATLDMLIEKVRVMAYLANVSGGEATWIICTSGKPIGVLAQQWSHARLTVPGDSTVSQYFAGDEPELSFRYKCQEDPDLVFDDIKQGKGLPSRFG